MIVICDHNPAWPGEIAHLREAQVTVREIVPEIKAALLHAGYGNVKDPVYDLIWDAAQDWARTTCWRPDES